MARNGKPYQYFLNRLLIITVASLLCGNIFSQPTVTAGLTGIPDTSYSTHAAYSSTRKTHPAIAVAQEIKSDSILVRENIVYSRTGERSLLADIFQPSAKTQQQRTVIIMIHGGGWRSGSRRQHHALAQQLALRGYICITPEYRLSTEALFPAALHDIKNLVKWVRNHAAEYGVDTSRIVLAGFSAGGQLAALAGATGDRPFPELVNDAGENVSSRVSAIIDIDGTLSFVHPESGESGDGKKISAAAYWLGYEKKDNPSLWEAASPLTYARHSPPVLFINSSVARMHAGRDDYITILNERGVYSEVHTFENSPHSFCLFHPWFLPTVKHMDDFLKKIFHDTK
ncbi:MAG TPA: alpha/beta hydrolase [Chitinophagaceae bacterium]|nr:alpha/beta hydrolase [Chitinophagaceae bacterium]